MSDGSDDTDPVAAFAAHVDHALRALRVEVDAMRAEVDTHHVDLETADEPVDGDLDAPQPVAPVPRIARLEEPLPEPKTPRARKTPKLRTLASVLSGVVIAVAVLAILVVSVGPAFLPYQTYFMRSGSMTPTIRRGAIVVLTEVDASELKVGDIVTFRNPEKRSTLVTHRIVAVESSDQGRVFVTKGDANRVGDPWRLRATGTSQRYWFNAPLIGYAFGFLAAPHARVALVVIPVAILLLLGLVSLNRRRRI